MSFSTSKILRFCALLLVGVGGGVLAQAAWAGAFSYSGFATAAVGKVIGGSRTERLSDHYDCPCFIADYSQGALYDGDWSMGQESKVGLQGTYKFNDKLSATSQIVGRGVNGVKTDVEWAYLSYDATPNWTVQAGRKRLPLYFYSEFQDVGFAYNWLRPPTDLYGWELVNYNGVNAVYRGDWGGWSAKSNFFTGREDSKDNRYSRIYYTDRQDVTWKHIAGADLELTRDWLTLRFNYITSQVLQYEVIGDVRTRTVPDPARNRSSERQNIYGVALNLDYNNWQFRSEYSVFDRSAYSYRSRAYMLSTGYRMGDFVPLITYSRYGEHNTSDPNGIQRDEGLALTLRYDLSGTSDIKVQFDRYRDRSGPEASFVGNSKQITIAYDVIF